jgi:hypothetical protein
MTMTTPRAQNVARRLFMNPGLSATTGGDPGSDNTAQTVAAAEQATRQLGDALTRWFGPYGYHALLTRALVDARSAHPVLAAVIVRSPLEPLLDGLADGARAHGNAAMTKGVTTVLATVIDLLGRLIGEDMALNLVEQSLPAVAPNAARQTDTEEAR